MECAYSSPHVARAERTGFARMAIEYGYTIVPVASVGMEEMLKVVHDIPLVRACAIRSC